MPQSKVVFIMGPGHCGSTLLDLMLGSHSTAFSLAEFHRISEFVDAETTTPQAVCAVCGDECAFWNQASLLPSLKPMYANGTFAQKIRRRCVRLVSNPYAPLFAATGKPMLIDSSKGAGWIARQTRLRYLWRDVTPYLIYIGRDGRAVANSYYRKYPDAGITQASEAWKRRVISMNRFYAAFPAAQKTRVQYERLATSPEDEIRRLSAFLGVPFEPAMITYWVHDHHPIAGNAGTHSLILRQRERAAGAAEARRLRVNQGDRFYSTSHYAQLDLGIELDLRWKTELKADEVQTFERIAGDLNGPFLPDFELAKSR
jgi:hypothetical protein